MHAEERVTPIYVHNKNLEIEDDGTKEKKEW